MRTLLLLLFLAIPVNGFALTLSGIRTQIRTIVKDSDSTRQRYADSVLNNLINVAQREASGASYAIAKSDDITLSVSTTYYALPTDLIAIKRVTFDNQDLRQTSPEGLDNDPGGAWIEQRGRPDRYFQDQSRLADIGIFPVPSTTSHLGDGTITVFYYAFADDLSGDSDVPFNAITRYTIYHDILTYYVAYRIFLIEGQVEKASAYSGLYETRLQSLINRANEQPNYRPSFSGGVTNR